MDNDCKVSTCTNPAWSRGWCSTHYGRVRKYGDPQEWKPVQRKGVTTRTTCRVPQCGRPLHNKISELCNRHYLRLRRQGDAEAPVSVIRDDDLVRFWSNIDKRGPAECWPWTGGARAPRHSPTHLYGRIKMNGRMVTATRYMVAEVEARELRTEDEVCHSCDNTLCMNPAHLFIGTHLGNIQDMDAKGRCDRPRGEANGLAKLSEEQVRQIRIWRASGMSAYRLGKIFNVWPTTIERVVSRKTWKHVA